MLKQGKERNITNLHPYPLQGVKQGEKKVSKTYIFKISLEFFFIMSLY
jgi:hypothetical protein